MSRFAAAILAILCASPASAQPAGRQPENIPPEILLETIRAAYDRKPTADEIKVSLFKGAHGARLPSDALASDTLTVRIDPGPPGSAPPARVFLDFGSLRVLIAGGVITAINPGVPGRYYQATLAGPLTPQSLARALPPTPVPELALACGDRDSLAALTPYTPNVAWTSAVIEANGRNGVLTGSSSAGPIVLTANAVSGRLSKLVAVIKGPGGEATLDLAVTAIEPGNPSTWTIPLEGRERANSLADLRSAPLTGPIAIGTPVPDLALQRMDSTAWSLHRALAESPAAPLALVLYRGAPERLDAASRDARAAAAVVRAVQAGQVSPGEPAVPPVDINLAAVLVMDLGQFNRAAFDREKSLWQSVAATRSPDAKPASTSELLWSNASSQSIDRVDGNAGAVLLLIAPDKTLVRVVRLDGRAGDPAGLAAELRGALRAPPR